MEDSKLTALRTKLDSLYNQHKEEMLFHGWHHIAFVSKKAKEFAKSINADAFLSESAAYVHDLNYLVEINSEPEKGAELRTQILSECGYSEEERTRIEQIVMEEHTATRGARLSPEGMALSDADTLFKALPITPILFASKYIQENKVDIEKLSKKVVDEQKPLLDKGIYFYTDLAKSRYLSWAICNLALWENVRESLEDEDVQELLALARQRGVL
jgi:uncharacterized protein